MDTGATTSGPGTAASEMTDPGSEVTSKSRRGRREYERRKSELNRGPGAGEQGHGGHVGDVGHDGDGGGGPGVGDQADADVDDGPGGRNLALASHSPPPSSLLPEAAECG